MCLKNTYPLQDDPLESNSLAYYDNLTRLPNRLLFVDYLTKIIAKNSQGKDIVVAVVGLDHFKLINDTLGLSFGDEVLRMTAERLSGMSLETAGVARIGSDEFAVLFTHLTDDAAIHWAMKQLHDVFKDVYNLSIQPVIVSCSVGVATYPRSAKNAEELIQNAQAALQEAKEYGKDQCRFYTIPPLTRESKRWQWEIDLRHALAADQFELYYQPRMDLTTGKVLGAEALLRWHNPHNILPEQFIAIAEKSDLIAQIGEWVITHAVKQRKKWADKGLFLATLSINLSARQFQRPDLVTTIDRIIKQADINPEWIEFELTESLLIKDIEWAINVTQELKKLGFLLALDDFGKGYSSLHYLSRFPFDTLKIDRSFIVEITESLKNKAIVQTIINLAHHLNLIAIAEGVETVEQFTVLRDLHCNQIQGFHFSKPLSALEMTALLSNEGSVTNWLYGI